MTSSSTILSMWTIYDHPSDHPQHFVLRRWLIGKGGTVTPGELYRAKSLAEARSFLPDGLIRLTRDPKDDLAVVETWV